MQDFIVESGVKGAYRINRRRFTGEGAHDRATAYAERIRRGNSIGSYWAEVKPTAEHGPCLDQHCTICPDLADEQMRREEFDALKTAGREIPVPGFEGLLSVRFIG